MLSIQSFCFNAFQENTYVLYNEQKEAIIVDPGCYLKNEQAQLANFISENELTPTLLLNTHCHLDHVFGNNYVSETYGLTAHIHPNEQIVLDRLPEAAAKWGVATEPYTGPVKYIQQDEIISFGKDSFKVLLTPGHSPGSVCFYNESQDFIIGGDLIFMDGVGRTDLPGGDISALANSIRLLAGKVGQHTLLLSSHDYAQRFFTSLALAASEQPLIQALLNNQPHTEWQPQLQQQAVTLQQASSYFCGLVEVSLSDATDVIAPEQLAAFLQQWPQMQVVDVREPHEQSAGALAQYLPAAYLAQHSVQEIPLSKLADAVIHQQLHKEQPLLLVCRSGNRSLVACKVLGRLGFQQVFNLKGGTALLC